MSDSRPVARTDGVLTETLDGELLVYDLDGDTASVDFDMGDIRFQRGSGSQAVPALVPEGIRDRYIFALHELLHGNASDLAAELLKQSAGGFDLRGARDELGFRSQVSTRRIGEHQNLLMVGWNLVFNRH